MMKISSILFIFILLSAFLVFPVSFSQVADRECPASAACDPEDFPFDELTNTMEDFAHLGFDKQSITIPASGSFVVVGPEEELFILSEKGLIITLTTPEGEIVYDGFTRGLEISTIPLPQLKSGETLTLQLTMLEMPMDLLRDAGVFPGDNPLFVGDRAAACINVQNELDGLYKGIQDRRSEITALRNIPGGFQNQTIQSLISRYTNQNQIDLDLIAELNSLFEVGGCERVPRDEQERPENRPTPDDQQVFQKATVVVLGVNELNDFDPTLELAGSRVFLSKPELFEFALLEPSDGYKVLSGQFGTLEYPSVISPGETFTIRYNNTAQDFEPSGETIDFVLETTRKFVINSKTADFVTSIEKNGSVVSTTLTLTDSPTVYFNLMVPELGMSGNGDSPVQFGLHFFHVHSDFTGAGTLNAYLPVYIAPSSEYNLIGYSLASEEQFIIDLENYVPNSPELFIAGKSYGVSTFATSQEFQLPITSIVISDNLGPITAYDIEINDDFATSVFDGKMFVLGNSNDDQFSISSLKIFNFTVDNYTTNMDSDVFGFPNELAIFANINTIDISVLDEFEQPYVEGQILIQKGNEEFLADLLSIPRLKLPNGDYVITHIVNDEIKSTREITISSSGLIEFNVSTLEQQDQILTIVIILESIVIAYLTLRVLLKYFRG